MSAGLSFDPTDESALLAAVRQPRTAEQAFGELMKQHQEALYWHIRRMVGTHADSDDVLQSTFIKAWKNIARFRGDSRLSTWLFRIATNESLTFLNRQQRRSYTDLSSLEDNVAHSSTSNDTLSGEEIQQKLEAAVAQLPDKQRQVFTLKYFSELKYTEIQAITGGSVGSLKASFHHAVKKIEHYLKKA